MGLKEEIRQTRPFASPEQEAFLAVLKTADVFRRRMAVVLAPFGLSLEQYNVLRILRGAGADGLPTLEVSARMIEQAPAITRLLDKLETKKLVRRERAADDRRQVLCWIAPAGLALLEELDQPVIEADRNLLGSIESPELQTLLQILAKLRTSSQHPYEAK